MNAVPPAVRVLIVEDNAADAFLIRKRLAEAQDVRFESDHIETLREAIEAIGRRDYDIILLDLNLSDSERMQTVRSVASATDAAIIVLTSQPDENLALKAIKAGIQDFLGKEMIGSPKLLQSIRFALERQGAHNRLHNLAYRDEITGLPNHHAFAESGRAMLADCLRKGRRVALHVLSLGNLKDIVMSDGLPVAEGVLKIAAGRLYGLAQGGKFFARLSGDSLGVVQPDAVQDGQALYFARRLTEILREPVECQGQSFGLDVRVGIAYAPDHADSWDDLMHCGALALENARTDQHQPCVIYSA